MHGREGIGKDTQCNSNNMREIELLRSTAK